MTYTNGYQSQNNAGASAYSPFNRTAGAQQPNYQGYPPAVNAPGTPPGATPGMATDTFVAPANAEDIDTLSGNIDSKIAQIRQAFSQPSAAPTMPPSAMPGTPAAPQAPAVSDADIQWALQLEQKVKSGQAPTAEETARYEDIAKRLQAQQQQPQAPAQPPAAPTAPQAPAVSQADIQWALQLEQKVKSGQAPTAEETARYEDIAKRLQAQQQQPQAPAQPPAAPAAPQAPAVSQADIQWALQLEQKVKSGQAPSAEETARYEDIAKRLQAQQQQQQAPPTGTQAAPQGPKNWADWSKPFTVPAAPTMPQPIAGPQGQAQVTVPTSLRGAPQTPPAAVLNQPPGAPAPTYSANAAAPNAAAPSQADIQWALQLEQKVNNQHYQPNAQETARYQDIAQRLAAAQQQGAQAPAQPQTQAPPQMPQAPAQQQPQQPQFQAQAPAAPQTPPQNQPLPGGLTQQEINWALQLEQRVKTQNYQPNQQELAAYESIAQRLQQGAAAQPQAPQQYAAAPQQQAPGTFQQNGQQWVTPQAPQATQIVPQNYPMVQGQTPQTLVPPPAMPQVGYPQQQQPGMPQQPPQYAQQQAPQQQKPGFMDKLKAAWNTLWS